MKEERLNLVLVSGQFELKHIFAIPAMFAIEPIRIQNAHARRVGKRVLVMVDKFLGRDLLNS